MPQSNSFAHIQPLEQRTLFSGFTSHTIVHGLTDPTAMEFAPDGRIFICEQGGTVRVIQKGKLLAKPFLTLPVNDEGERGLLGIAFDPKFKTNHFVYVYYTSTSPTTHNRVSRFTASGNVAVSGSERHILDLNNLSGATNHNGGSLHFGPDGKLYIGVGENADGSNAQSLSNLLGKILRINPNGTIPTDNPFFNQATGKNRAIFALGLRNPFTFAFQPGTGRLFIDDVGQDTTEEIDEGQPGANYGWPTTEGPTNNPDFTSPLFSYPHGANDQLGVAITGGVFYNPTNVQFPANFIGKYFFSDLGIGFIHVLDPNTKTASGFATGINQPVDLDVGPDGGLYVLARGGDNGFIREFLSTATSPPQITRQPQNVSRRIGHTATFSVKAKGTAPLTFQWQRNGKNIAGANESIFSFKVRSTDANDTFRVVVRNSVGKTISETATFTLLPTASFSKSPIKLDQ